MTRPALRRREKNFPQMLQMLLLISAGNDNVVKVAEVKGESRQDPVHHALEGVACIAQPEGHAAKLEQFDWCADGCLSDAGCIGLIGI
jgi:hypothetical protein